MPIEFTCPGCTSRHACAAHMAGRQFRCSGCGKILTVPAVSGEAISQRPRRTSADPGESYAEAEERAAAMGPGLQTALLVIGGGLIFVLMAGFCLGFGFWIPRTMAPPPVAPGRIEEGEAPATAPPAEAEITKERIGPNAVQKK